MILIICRYNLHSKIALASLLSDLVKSKPSIYLPILFQAFPVIEIMVKDITGRTIKVEKMQIFKGSNTVLLSSFNTLQKGSFIIQVKSATGLINKVIQKK